MKKVLSLFLSIIMLFSVTAGLDYSAYAIADSGSCGTNVTYTYTNNNGISVLTISGTGAMTDYTFPNYYNYLTNSPFRDETINYIVIKDGVTSIGARAFKNCNGLISVTIPDSVTSIGDYAFNNTSLEDIKLPDSIKSIGEYAFAGCWNLKSIVIPEGIKKLSVGLFSSFDSYGYYGCDNLQSVSIPDTVENIEAGAFYGCSKLKDITIPESVKKIGESAFGGCDALEEVNTRDLKAWCKITFENNYANPLTYASGTLYENYVPVEELTIPKSITSIKDYAFSGCTSLKILTVPESVTSIGASSFFGCTELETVIIGENVASLGSEPFKGCTEINSLYLVTQKLDSTQDVISGMPADSTLYAYPSTDAKTYCDIYGVDFVPLEEPKCDEGEHTCYETVTKKATCTEKGEKKLTCVFCGETSTKTIPERGHTPGRAMEENRVEPTCTEYGSYDEVIYCDVCGEELSRAEVMLEMIEHTPGEEEYENVVEPTCISFGSYDEVIYCAVCGEELSREAVILDMEGHTPSWDYVIENKKPATCVSYGTYDEVLYCDVCGKELERETYRSSWEYGPHTYGEKSVTPATAKSDGSVKQYCSTCGKLIYASTIPKVKSFWLSKEQYTYNGKVKKPAVSIYNSDGNKLVEGTDYTVVYPSGMVEPNEYEVKVLLIGNYTGILKDYFYIYPKSTKITKLRAGKRKITVKWKKASGPCDGYRIEYSTDKSFKHYKYVYVKGRNKTKKTIKGLKKGKKYYIKVWTCKNSYMNYSKTKSVRTLGGKKR